MPIHRRVNKEGTYYQWGNSGKKYYYQPKNKKSRTIAYNKAARQAAAAYASGYKMY